MTKFIAIASAKGGVGKTTTAINLGTALTGYGKDVIVVDANLSTPNVGIYLGSPNVPVSLHDVLAGRNHISEAIYMHSHGLKVVPGSISVKHSSSKHHHKLPDVILNLAGMAEIVIIDSGAGITDESLAAIKSADEVIIVTNPELASLTDALKTIKLAEEHSKKVTGIIITRANEDELDVSNDHVEVLLEKKILGTIPEDPTVRAANHMKHPVTYTHPDSSAAVGYKKLAAKLLGQKYVASVEKKEDTFMDYLLKRLGLK